MSSILPIVNIFEYQRDIFVLFNNPKIIFTHIPKTGGGSIEHLFARTPWLLERDGRLGQHGTLQKAHDIYGNLSEYRMFTVVRNTYHRIVSLYCMPYFQDGRGFMQMELIDNKKRKLLLEKGEGFVTFPVFYNRIYEKFKEDGGKFHYGEDYFYYNGINDTIPDHLEVIAFENLETEFEKLWCEKWELEMNIKFPHMNKNGRSDSKSSVRDHLIRDPKFIKVVEEVYEKEIDYFNFSPY